MADALEDIDENRRYTYADYLSWDGPERYQLINGDAAVSSVVLPGFSVELKSLWTAANEVSPPA